MVLHQPIECTAFFGSQVSGEFPYQRNGTLPASYVTNNNLVDLEESRV